MQLSEVSTVCCAVTATANVTHVAVCMTALGKAAVQCCIFELDAHS